MPTLNECANAGEKVCGYEERSPGFVLPDVHALVGAGHLERTCVPAEHHVSQRHRIGASRQRGKRGERSFEQWTVCLDDAVNNRNTSTPGKGERQRNAQECCRPSPEITEKPVHYSIMGRSRRTYGFSVTRSVSTVR
jgi:hypothetical protein